MAARQLIIPGAMPSRDANGRALPAKLRFYVAATALTTPAIVYTASDLVTPHPFPILSDSAGRWPQMWADQAASFDVAWSDQVFDKTIGGPFLAVSPANDAVLASVALADASVTAAQTARDAALAASTQAQASAASISGAPFSATSITSLSIGTGLKAPVLTQTGKLFSAGQSVVIARTSAPSNQMVGIIQSVVGQLVTVDVSLAAAPGGAGPYTDWTMSLASANGVLSVIGLSGAILAPALKAALAITTADITNFNATAAQVRTGTTTTAALTPGDTYSALAEVTLTDAATIAVDMSSFINAVVTLGGNRTLGVPSFAKVGQCGYIRVVQDATGSRTLAFAANWKRDGGAPTLSTTAAATDYIFYQVITAALVIYSFVKAPS